MAAVEVETGSRLARFGRAALSALRPEDFLLAGWVGLANPLLTRSSGNGDPFTPDRPLEGALQLLGVAGAIACLATRTAAVTPDGSRSSDDRSGEYGAYIGPATGGLMLVGASGVAGLGFAPESAMLPVFGAVAFLPLFRNLLPALSPRTRRALVTPFVLAAGGIFWSFVRGATGGAGLFRDVGSLIAVAPSVAPLLGLLTLAAAVYYAMLVFAPRQIADREGGPAVWLFRFGLFMAGLLLGFGWLGVLGQ
jgi:hypothetical protein